MEATTYHIGVRGYDKCFDNGRIDALRAVRNQTGHPFRTVPPCGEPN